MSLRTTAASTLLCFAVALGVTQTGRAAAIVVPNALTAIDGNNGGNTGILFRLQQVYAASEFSGSGRPILITAIRFRPDTFSQNRFNITNPNLQINFSTTTRSPDGLSATFADNVGADDTVAHSGPISLSTANTGPVVGPRDFDIVIPLTRPFVYDSSAGNLLVDFRSTGELFPFNIAAPAPVDAENSTGDSISIVIGNLSSFSGEATTFAFVTQFMVSDASTSIPTLSDWFIGVLAGLVSLTGLASLRRRVR